MRIDLARRELVPAGPVPAAMLNGGDTAPAAPNLGALAPNMGGH